MESLEQGQRDPMEIQRRVVQGKGRLVALLFHTMRYPGMHQSTHQVSRDFNLEAGRQLRTGTYPTAEAPVLDDSISTREKAWYVLDQFAPVARAVPSGEPAYSTVLAICSEGVDTVGSVERFCAPDGTQLHVEELLPPQEVVEGMYSTYMSNRRNCLVLERFIDTLQPVSQPS